MSATEFDYEAAVWGEETVVAGEHSIAGFRLDEALAWLPERGRVLELGCGAGRFLRAIALARPGLEPVGIDVSRRALALAAQHAECRDLRLQELPEAALPARDGEFDAVVVLDVLEHVEDPMRTLDEIRRVLRPGGTFHLHVPCEGDPRCLWRWLPGQAGERGLKRRLAGHLWRFRRREILAALESRGFELLRTRGSLHLLGNLADVAVLAGMALARRLRPDSAPASTGELMARAAQPGGGIGARLTRAVDALLWLEARLLGRFPSWALHVSARRTVSEPRR